MKSLLQPCTLLTIKEITKPTKIEPGFLYLMMPNTTLKVEKDKLIPKKRDHALSINHPINTFFTSLATNYHEKAIGIILSGTGTDGSSGVLSIDEVGGKILVQKPEDAEFNGMPLSAIATNTANYVLPIDRLAVKLHHITKNIDDGITLIQDIINDHEGFDRIILFVKLFSGVDFTGYKKTTLIRRLAKRIVHLELKNLKEYGEYIEAHVEEASWLSDDFLIGVTNFLETPTFGATLRKKLYRNLFKKNNPTKPLKYPVLDAALEKKVTR